MVFRATVVGLVVVSRITVDGLVVIFRVMAVGRVVVFRATVVGPVVDHVIGTRGVVEQVGVVTLWPSLAVHSATTMQH